MIPCLSAPEARQLAKRDIEPEQMCSAILLAAYASIYNSAICGSTSIAQDFEGIDEDAPAVGSALKKAAELLRRNGYRVKVQGVTGAEIEWSAP